MCNSVEYFRAKLFSILEQSSNPRIAYHKGGVVSPHIMVLDDLVNLGAESEDDMWNSVMISFDSQLIRITKYPYSLVLGFSF